MPGGNTFAFKHFTIIQDKCAMKVGTDAVLIGAWVYCQTPPNRILDIGTGTGIIALMLAQKFENTHIDAIDIDDGACIQAQENVKNSPWHNRISIIKTALQHFTTEYKYNLIVSNPPYFINSSKTLHEARTTARHNDYLPYHELADNVIRLLSPDGCFFVILPQKEGELFIQLAEERKLYLNKITRVKTKQNSPISKRLLMQFSLKRETFSEDELIIETEGRHKYSDEYKALTRDYYLNF